MNLNLGNFNHNYPDGNSFKLSASGLHGDVYLGESVEPGDVLTFDTVLGAYLKAIADGSQTSPALVMALKPGSIGETIRGLFYGVFQMDGWDFQGLTYLSPTTAGTFTATKPTTAGQAVQPLGLAVGDTIIFNPEMDAPLVPEE